MKIGEIKKNTLNISAPEQAYNELLSIVVKGLKVQNETLKSIEGYLKFFFWLELSV